MNTIQKIIETLKEVDSDICDDLNILIGELVYESKQEVFDDLEIMHDFCPDDKRQIDYIKNKHLRPITEKGK